MTWNEWFDYSAIIRPLDFLFYCYYIIIILIVILPLSKLHL